MEDKPSYTPAEVARMMETYWATRTTIDSITSILDSEDMVSDDLEGTRKDLRVAGQLTFDHARDMIPANVIIELREPYSLPI